MRDRLIELISKVQYMGGLEGKLADHLLANGVIVPPCKVGDTVYKICTVNSKIKMGSLWDGRIVNTNCDRCGYRNCHCETIGLRRHEPEWMVDVIVEKKVYSLVFLSEIMPYFGTFWFTTKEEAEQSIARMKGEGE